MIRSDSTGRDRRRGPSFGAHAAVTKWIASVVIAVVLRTSIAATVSGEIHGRVTFRDAGVPGASIIATRVDAMVEAVTGDDGTYSLPLAEGDWTIRVEMSGFVGRICNVVVRTNERVSCDLQLDIADLNSLIALSVAPDLSSPASASPTVRSRAQEQEPAADADEPFLINGSVNTTAASASPNVAAFGNFRTAARSIYKASVGVFLGSSGLDAKPFAFAGRQTPSPGYHSAQVVANWSGPVRIPRLTSNGPLLYIGYQRLRDKSIGSVAGLMPTPLERSGDFSRSLDAAGRPVQILDPSTGLPFPNAMIPAPRISPEAVRLLRLFPRGDGEQGLGTNYQRPSPTLSNLDAVQARYAQNQGLSNQIYGTIAYDVSEQTTSDLFGLADSKRADGLDIVSNWWRRLSSQVSMRLRHRFRRLGHELWPAFAQQTNVSGEAGITGNDQQPENWGPPNLLFSSGITNLTRPQSASGVSESQMLGAETVWVRGRHSLAIGGDVRLQQWDELSQQNARGTWSFSGIVTGSALADFLLGLPQTSAVSFGNARKQLSNNAYDVYVGDDWRLAPGVTLNAGLRWEYEAPVQERFGQLVNLDISPGFASAHPVLASDRANPNALLAADRSGIQPRVAVAIRPKSGSSLVVRAGYGVYRDSGYYEPIALLLAEQPPLAISTFVQADAEHPLSMADGFNRSAAASGSTFAVDPQLRGGYVKNWQVMVQRDLPAALTLAVIWSGARGSHLMQQSLPNTIAPGAVDDHPTFPRGFVYLMSNGSSKRRAAQVQLRRRLHNGLAANLNYTYSRATDNATAISGPGLNAASIAQDWTDLNAEWAPSLFNQEHLLVAHVEFTSGVGAAQASIDGMKGAWLKGWTLAANLTTGSGRPMTPIYLLATPGSTIIGAIRPDVATGLAQSRVEGAYANPNSYAQPTPGQWGNATRHSIQGPGELRVDAAITKRIEVSRRLNIEAGLEATNLLNQVTFAAIDLVAASPQFGLPTTANPMRKIQSTVRFRF